VLGPAEDSVDQLESKLFDHERLFCTAEGSCTQLAMQGKALSIDGKVGDPERSFWVAARIDRGADFAQDQFVENDSRVPVAAADWMLDPVDFAAIEQVNVVRIDRQGFSADVPQPQAAARKADLVEGERLSVTAERGIVALATIVTNFD